MNPEPQVTKALVEWAEEIFPDQCPNLNDTDRSIWYRAGQASVAKKLRQLFEDQTTQVLL